jgi:hypothetical protein
MKNNTKQAIKVGSISALTAGAVAFCIGNPVVWGAVGLFAYRMGKLAYNESTPQDRESSHS